MGATVEDSKFDDFWISNSDIEMQMFELKIRHMKKMILINIYRPPSGTADAFLDTLTNALQAVNNLHEYEIYILGDCNLPYNQVKSPSHKKLKDFEAKFGLTQLVNTPTRYAPDTANILDLIFTNSKYVKASGTFETHISDHEPVYVVRKKARIRPERVSFRCRTFGNYSKDCFQEELNNFDWTEFFELEDPDTAWSYLYELLLNVADKHCPFKDFVSKKYKPPWINQEILEKLRDRDRLYKSAKKSMDIDVWKRAKEARNRCHKMIKRAKNDYVISELNECAGDGKKFWSIINSTFTGDSTKSQAQIQLVDPSTRESVPSEECPNYINKFLTSAGPKLANNIPHVPFKLTFSDFLTKMKINRITVEETLELIKNIDIGKSSALDNLSSSVLKDALLALPIQLCYIFNLSVQTGIFPTSWKCSNIILIRKDGDKTDPNNYRPISLLPLPGKMLEKIIHARLYKYLMDNSILTSKQGGFRPEHSTTLTASAFVTHILEQFNEGNFTAAMFVDLRKALDTIDHHILLSKLRSYGLRNKVRDWFASYLSNRTQPTLVNGSFSDLAAITHGVPQGSVLGPALFLIFINDVTNVIDHQSIFL